MVTAATLAALQLLIQLTQQATQLGQALRKAHDEGRDITPDELDAFARKDDEARDTLQAAIDQARAGTPGP